MSWVTIIIDPSHNKVKIDWFYLKKSSSAQSEEIGSYIYFLNLVTSTVLVATVFFSQFPNPFPLGSSFYFIPPSAFHLYPPRVD